MDDVHYISRVLLAALRMILWTVGPLILSALMAEDMYLAGSMLMVLSVLGIMGTLVSDLLLFVVGPTNTVHPEKSTVA